MAPTTQARDLATLRAQHAVFAAERAPRTKLMETTSPMTLRLGNVPETILTLLPRRGMATPTQGERHLHLSMTLPAPKRRSTAARNALGHVGVQRGNAALPTEPQGMATPTTPILVFVILRFTDAANDARLVARRPTSPARRTMAMHEERRARAAQEQLLMTAPAGTRASLI